MKNIVKKICVLSVLMSLVVGCSSKDKENKTVAIIQLVEHTSLNTIKNAFDDEMKQLGYTDDNTNFVFKNAQGDMNIAASIVQDFKSQEPDVVVAIATPVAQASAVLSETSPVIFSAVSDPIGSNLVSSLENPDKNITGTSDEIQVDLILEKALLIDPSLKKLGVIYNKGEANSVTNIQKAKEFAKSKNIEIVEATITNINEVQTAMDTLTSKCDAIFAPNDNTVASAMDLVSDSCLKAKIPLYVGADSMVQDGGFLSVGIDYEELGRETARMVDKVLEGEDVKNIPVKVYNEDLFIYVNEDVLEKLGLDLPNEIKESELYKKIS